MNLLIHGRFYPSVGGVETVLRLLATEWQRAGEGVVVVSDVRCDPEDREDFPFAMHYRPGPLRWVALMRWADVFVHMNLSLKALWPRLVAHKLFVVVHHGFYYSDRVRGRRDFRERLKLRLLPRAINIAVSQAVASRLPVRCAVIPNPFDDSVFQVGGRGGSDRELIFIGRLVSEKGVALLIRSLRQLREQNLRPRLTIVGDGPERMALEGLVSNLNLRCQVAFVGRCAPRYVATLLRRHLILVIPSICEEAYGVVALEGAGCGCVVLGSDGGGMPEAIGPTGLTFRRGDLQDLTSKLSHLLLNPDELECYRNAVAAHLESHRPHSVALRYLSIIDQSVRAPGRRVSKSINLGRA
jgi:glycosyltransferase involved in cell wall biosynthesis